MLGRRFLILVAVLMGLTAVAASLAPRQPTPRDQRAATPTPAPAPAVDGAAEPIDRGTLLELTVQASDELDSVSLLDQVEPITPEAAAIFNVYADQPGTHPIMLVGQQREIATLVVRD